MIYAKWALGLTVLIAQQHGGVDALRAASSNINNNIAATTEQAHAAPTTINDTKDMINADAARGRELGYVPINTCLTEEHCNKARQRMGVDTIYYYVDDL